MYSQDRTYLLKQNEALFQATLMEFSKNPYDIASTNVIIKNSSYNKGSFYYRFKAKEDIYYALIDYVYTKNLALFNKDNLKLQDITDPIQLIDILFRYTKALANEDTHYFDLLKRIHHENKTLKQDIKTNCLESFQSRVFDRLRDLLVEYDYTELLINNINSILYTYLDDFNHLDEDLKSIKTFLFKNQRMVTTHLSNETLFFSELPEFLNYILVSDLMYDLSYYEEYRIKRQLLNESDTLSEIRSLFKIETITLEKVIESGMNRNARDFSDLINLNHLNYANKDYSTLTQFEKIVVLTVYNIFLGKEYIIFDHLFDGIEFKDLKYLLTDLLPKASLVNKVIVIDQFAMPSLLVKYNTYKVVDHNFMNINLNNSKLNDETLFIEYLESDTINNVTMDKSSNDFIDFIRNNTIISITSKHKISLKDIM